MTGDFEITDRMVDVATDAFYEHQVSQARKIVSERLLPTETVKAVLERARRSSDREAAIVLFSLVEDITTSFFREKLKGDVPEGLDQAFFKGNAMLSSAHNRNLLLLGLE